MLLVVQWCGLAGQAVRTPATEHAVGRAQAAKDVKMKSQTRGVEMH